MAKRNAALPVGQRVTLNLVDDAGQIHQLSTYRGFVVVLAFIRGFT